MSRNLFRFRRSLAEILSLCNISSVRSFPLGFQSSTGHRIHNFISGLGCRKFYLFDPGCLMSTVRGHCQRLESARNPCDLIQIMNEPMHEKTNNVGFRQGPTQTRLCSHRIKLEALSFGYK